MKKIITALFVLTLTAGISYAQDLAQATEMFNNAANALNSGDKTAALDQFKAVLPIAESLGEEGTAIVENCKKYIPQVNLSIAKDFFKDSDMDSAIAALKESAGLAEGYGNAEVAEEVASLLPQFLLQKGNTLFSAKDFANAAEAYREAAGLDPENGVLLLRLGMALAGLGKTEEAVESYKKAAQFGQEATANKQLSTIFLKKAAAFLSSGNFEGALDAAKESLGFLPNATAYKVAGNAAAKLKDYKGAAEMFTKYLELSPNAKDAAQTKANIEAFLKL